jgi:outer membrane protein OmpA-like peptidoglycan-associated protein
MRGFRSVAVLASILSAAASVPAQGQDLFACQDQLSDPVRCLDVQLFRPTTSTGTTFTLDRPSVLRHLALEAGLGASVAAQPFRRSVVDAGGDAVDELDVVGWLAQAELLVAVGLFEVLELGAAVPVGVVERVDGDVAMASSTSTRGVVFGLADPRLSVKVPLLRTALELAARLEVTLPIGNDDEFLGTGYWTLTPSVVAAVAMGRLTLGADLGYRQRQRVALVSREGGGVQDLFEQDDEIETKLGANVRVVDALELLLEAQLRVGVGGRSIGPGEIPFEWRAGARVIPTPGLTLDVGAGAGFGDGYGVPAIRGFLIARYATEPERCPYGPEDYDGFEDGDFCADPDNDADGIEDDRDECPNDPEDYDQFLDEDGCPDPDNDADGVNDVDDACPLVSEDIDGYRDTDGCPEPDNDEDGIADAFDACPNDPEDIDQYEDLDGCPEPGPGQATVTVTERRILISERIYFDFDRDTIRSVSQPLLDQVAQAILRIADRRRIRVEGYTDSEGDDQYNTDLSYRRARSVVQYLVSRGVPRIRLEYQGYGEINPVAPNDSPEGKALNRRVEFTIFDAP